MAILIVGASVAGIRTAQALRMRGCTERIVLVGEELHHPYDKPPLSKENLADGAGPVPLLTTEELAALDVDLRLGVRAASLDPVRRQVSVSDGSVLDYTQLVIATGVKPRTLPVPPLAGVHTIRTADDAADLRTALSRKPKVVVIGAGFIGAEFASAARGHGCDVAIVETQDVPMSHLFGPEVGGLIAALHTEHGVDLHTGVRFDHFEGTGHVSGVALSDGRVLPADLVVVGIGAQPATAWLSSSGLPIADGVECDAELRVIGFDDIHAAGDVARWPHPLYAADLRIEHWTNANEHGAAVAASILGLPAPAMTVPYVWSDQYDHRIQLAGRPALGALVHRSGTADDHLIALYADHDGVLVGGVVIDDPRTLMKVRKGIAGRRLWAEVDLTPKKLPVAT